MKQIYRIPEQKKIAGICAGVADMFSLDPTLVRLATVFICVATFVWPMIVTYLVGWFIIPEKAELMSSAADADHSDA